MACTCNGELTQGFYAGYVHLAQQLYGHRNTSEGGSEYLTLAADTEPIIWLQSELQALAAVGYVLLFHDQRLAITSVRSSSDNRARPGSAKELASQAG